MDNNRCGNCAHFVKWAQENAYSHEPEPEGVCTAPRPLFGTFPNREVRLKDGRNCPMWKRVYKQNE